MKIAILYICTGKYDIFWSDFYSTSQKYFCTTEDKHYFVFTDSEQIKADHNVSVIYQDSLGWPFNTLYRYRMFLRVQHKLSKFDKVIFFNGNCTFVDQIDYENFFGRSSTLVACLHPGFLNKNCEEFTYEKRKNSLAFVGSPWKYFAGGINGGNANEILKIFQILSHNIEDDLKNGIVAIWHDESHWNAYLNNNYEVLKDKLHILSPEYLYPEGWDLPFEKKIILRDKNQYGGHNLLRGAAQHNFPNTIKKILKKIICR
ncbi:MAG: hypothetical protein EKK54_02545 [Neisseriaceae bacterium]|nr:MAG: hypothetical protein EKK54_02545 [Neisseriaceae bacterium]